MKLHGPAHPDEFRVKVGRWGDRHYHDPLPACDIAPATDAVWPSVTVIKNAAGKDWSWTSLERAAGYLADKRAELDGMNAREIHSRLLEVNKAGLTRAGDRGSSIHNLIEAKALGLPETVIPDAIPYVPAVDAFLADCAPEWVLSEVVVINRALGYGGTLDAGLTFLLETIRGTHIVDWKTRRSADKHAAYPEERWQVGAYGRAEYMIINRDGQAVRERLPDLAGGLIVSLAPEGYRVYPVDLDEAFATFTTLNAFWKAKNAENYSPRHLSIPRSTPAVADPALVDKLRAEVLWIKEMSPAGIAALAKDWPDGVPTFKDGGPTDADQTTLLAMLVERVKRDCDVPFNPADNPPPVGFHDPDPDLPARAEENAAGVGPDEGAHVPDAKVEKLRKKMYDLPALEFDWIAVIAQQANEDGRGISLRQQPTERRYNIAKGLIAMAPHGEDELLRALVALAVDDDSLTEPTLSAGAVVASLGAVEAAAFAALCEQYANRGLPTVVGDDNRLRVQRAAA